MNLKGSAQEIYNEIKTHAIIDAHEHLPSEKDYLSSDYSGPNFFAGYVFRDMASAGLDNDTCMELRDPGYKKTEEWWPLIKPYWEKVKYGAYARSLKITAKDLYNISKIDDNSIKKLAQCVISDNKKGLYEKILKKKCRAKYVLSTSISPEEESLEDSFLKATPFLLPNSISISKKEILALNKNNPGRYYDFDKFVEYFLERIYKLLKSKNTAGFKYILYKLKDNEKQYVKKQYDNLLNGESKVDLFAVESYIIRKIFSILDSMDKPATVAFHSGIYAPVRTDFRKTDPKNILEFANDFKNIKFDLFHLGMPMARDAVIAAKSTPNVYLNLCWCYILSQRVTAQYLDEIIDFIPLNKITAFGGDYRCVVQKVWGHLVMARQTVSHVLGKRVDMGDMTLKDAVDIADMFFYHNPKEIYNL